MLEIVTSNQFKKDLKLARKRGYVEPDWLLIYRISQTTLTLFLFRTGTHSDLF